MNLGGKVEQHQDGIVNKRGGEQLYFNKSWTPVPLLPHPPIRGEGDGVINTSVWRCV